ncbi:uncharacterized protein LOC119688806 [Teleopsis dalmanni]|nr:uncharacterized protein LOC119688806 [Teleopsis dalmanni]
MAEHVMLLTGFFAHPYDNFQFDDLRLQRLHDILTIMYNTTNYQSENILRELAPDCKETVIRGLLFGTPVSPNGFFFKRITPSSICCMFNYRRDGYATREVNVSKNERTIKFESNSVLNSVQFVLQNKRNEYTYTELSNSGFQLYVFPTDDFFIQSNTNGEVMVTDNSIVEIPIVPIFLESNQNIRKFSPQIRQCYFQDEGQKIINR